MEKLKVLAQGRIGDSSNPFIHTPPTGKAHVTSCVIICSTYEDDPNTTVLDSFTYSVHIIKSGTTPDYDPLTTTSIIINQFKIDATDSNEVDVGSITLGDGDKLVAFIDDPLFANKAVITIMGSEVS